MENKRIPINFNELGHILEGWKRIKKAYHVEPVENDDRRPDSATSGDRSDTTLLATLLLSAIFFSEFVISRKFCLSYLPRYPIQVFLDYFIKTK